jgi:hypothetical protein
LIRLADQICHYLEDWIHRRMVINRWYSSCSFRKHELSLFIPVGFLFQ